MGFLDIFKTKKDQTFSRRFSDLFLSRVGGIQTYHDNSRVYVEKGYQDNPVVHAITSITAKHGSKAPWVIKSKATDDIIDHTLLNALMDRPNTDTSWEDFIQNLITQYVLTGNGFAACDKGTGLNEGKPSSIYILPSEETQIISRR